MTTSLKHDRKARYIWAIAITCMMANSVSSAFGLEVNSDAEYKQTDTLDDLKKFTLFGYHHLVQDILAGKGEYLDSLLLMLGKEEDRAVVITELRKMLVAHASPMAFSEGVIQLRNNTKHPLKNR